MTLIKNLKINNKIKGFALLESVISAVVVGGFLITYQNQQVNKQLIFDALNYTKASQIAVVKYYENNGVLPTTNQQAKIPNADQISHPAVSDISVGEFGQITITISVNEEIFNKTIVLEPHVKQGKIVWKCTNGSLDDIYRPDKCIEKDTSDKFNQDELFNESDVNYL